MIFLVYLYSKK